MASRAPAACSFCAMPQAMERLLARPKTTAVLPARLIMPVVPSVLRPLLRIPVAIASAAEIDEFDPAHGAAEKTRAQALKLLDRVGGKAADLGAGLAFVGRV